MKTKLNYVNYIVGSTSHCSLSLSQLNILMHFYQLQIMIYYYLICKINTFYSNWIMQWIELTCLHKSSNDDQFKLQWQSAYAQLIITFFIDMQEAESVECFLVESGRHNWFSSKVMFTTKAAKWTFLVCYVTVPHDVNHAGLQVLVRHLI